MHPRTEIRHAARDVLIGKTAAGTRVEASRVYPWRTSELPAIAVYVDDETVKVESGASSPREYERHADLVIEAGLMLSAGVDDAADAIAEEIEKVFNDDRYITSTVGESTLTGTQLLEASDGERPIAVVRLTYDVLYRTSAVDSAALNNFEKAGVTTNLANAVHASNDAEDLVVLPQ